MKAFHGQNHGARDEIWVRFPDHTVPFLRRDAGGDGKSNRSEAGVKCKEGGGNRDVLIRGYCDTRNGKFHTRLRIRVPLIGRGGIHETTQ